MDSISVVKSIIGLALGISLFLFGMDAMGGGLKKVAGNRLESYLYKLTNTPIKGILLGAAVTAVIQSSSATSVMVVGFVNAGMMEVVQGIGIIMGANIGTSITGWILSLNFIGGGESSAVATLLGSTTIAAVFALGGVLVGKIGKRDSLRSLGDIMLGFAVLMEGMSLMKNAMEPFGQTQVFRDMISTLSNPFLGILVGIVFTAILQSASASVGVLQSIAMGAGTVLPFSAALPMTMGIGVGAAAPVLISGMQSTSKNGKRTALVYLINDLFGMIIWAVIFYAGQAIITKGGQFSFMNMKMDAVTIALMNTVYRILTIVALGPFIKQINKLVFWLVKESPEEDEDKPDFDLLEERFIEYPDLALAQSHTVMNSMATKASKNVYRAIKLLSEYSDDKFQKVQNKESIIDKYEDKVGTYLMAITGKDLNVAQTKEATKFLHTLSDFERIGDHASGISKVARELNEKKLSFSAEANKELEVYEKAVSEIVSIVTKVFIENDVEKARDVEPLRQVIRTLGSEIKNRHIKRLSEGKCSIEQGFPLNDLLTNLDRIAAHCSNIAVAMIEIDESEFDTHAYIKGIREMKDGSFAETFKHYDKKYNLDEL